MHSLATRPPADRSASPPSTTRTFTAAQCDALFEAILVDDVVDAETRLPERIGLDYPAATLEACFGLCRRLWEDGFDRPLLIAITARLARGGTLDEAQRHRFKAVRAKFKHFRYAYRLYAADHRVPPSLDRVTIVMGKLQDAIRNRHRIATIRHALALRLLLLAPFVRRMEHEAHGVRIAGGASFRAMLERDGEALAALLAQPTLTGRELHDGRKIIGRHVSFYDTLRTLSTDPEAYDMSRSLSAINGLMGSLHDELVVGKMIDPGSYDRDRFALPLVIAQRLADLVDTYHRAIRGDNPTVG